MSDSSFADFDFDFRHASVSIARAPRTRLEHPTSTLQTDTLATFEPLQFVAPQHWALPVGPPPACSHGRRHLSSSVSRRVCPYRRRVSESSHVCSAVGLQCVALNTCRVCEGSGQSHWSGVTVSYCILVQYLGMKYT